MRKIVLPIVVLLTLLLLSSTGLAGDPGKVWWTEFTSGVFTLPGEAGVYTYTYEDQGGGTTSYTIEVAQDAPEYPGVVLLRPWSIRARTGEPGLSCAELDPPSIRPGQLARFHIAWITDEVMSHQEAEALFDTLSYTVSWDGGAQTVSLARQVTRPDLDQVELYDMTCLWTFRR